MMRNSPNSVGRRASATRSTVLGLLGAGAQVLTSSDRASHLIPDAGCKTSDNPSLASGPMSLAADSVTSLILSIQARHFTYALLNQLITVLKARLTSKALNEVLREVGRALGGNQTSGGDLETRVDKGLMALEAIGGSARVEKEKGKLFIRSGSCPLSAAVAEHPEVCQLAESLLSEIIGAKVREQCEREGSPRCSFEVTER